MLRRNCKSTEMRNVTLNNYDEDNVFQNNVTSRLNALNGEDIYHRTMVDLPLWYHTIVSGVLTSVGIVGGILNSLVLRHFWLRRNIKSS